MSIFTCPKRKRIVPMSTLRSIVAGLLIAVAAGLVIFAGVAAYNIRAENILQAHRMHVVRELLATDTQALVVLSPEGRIVEWSPGATSIFGWTLSEVGGSYPDFLMTPDVWHKHCAKLLEMQHGQMDPRRVSAIDCWAIAKGDQLVQVHVVVSSFHDGIGYYHIALISRIEDFRRLASSPKPTGPIVSVLPHPEPIKAEPGIYTPFQQ